jgi:hypothetical protein
VTPRSKYRLTLAADACLSLAYGITHEHPAGWAVLVGLLLAVWATGAFWQQTQHQDDVDRQIALLAGAKDVYANLCRELQQMAQRNR